MSEKFSFYGVYTSHMVLQRGKAIPFSGIGTPGAVINVKFGGVERVCTVGRDGEWKVVFPAMSAGGPYSLSASCGKSVITMEDILIGDVWMCSGQSNMEMPVGGANPFFRTKDYLKELKNANHPEIRLFNSTAVRLMAPKAPCKDVTKFARGWEVCNSKTVEDFSACAYFFGRQLQTDMNIPIGLISAAWGGTNIEAYISAEKYAEKNFMPVKNDVVQKQSASFLKLPCMKPLLSWLESFEKECGTPDPDWFAHKFDDSDWDSSERKAVLGKVGRYVSRIILNIPAKLAGKDLKLQLGIINDMDSTYFNGKLIGKTGIETGNYYAVQRIYTVPGKLVHAGKNVIAVQADNHFCSGEVNLEFFELPDHPELEFSFEIRTKLWKAVSKGFPIRPDVPSASSNCVVSPASPNYPSTLYNAMLYPWFRYPVTGFIWYQGCNNAGTQDYYQLHKMLIDDMREHWNMPEMPFLIVQLAAFYSHNPEKRNDETAMNNLEPVLYPTYAITREIQAEMAVVRKNVGVIPAFDVGDHSDIHPRDKQTLGYRLALKAESIMGLRNGIISGPEFAGMRFEKGNIRVFFKKVGSGLTTTDGKAPIGFLAGDSSGNLYIPNAKIQGDTVLLSSGGQIQFVRYAFANYCRVNLINKEGFPAMPFRSDKIDYEKIFLD